MYECVCLEREREREREKREEREEHRQDLFTSKWVSSVKDWLCIQCDACKKMCVCVCVCMCVCVYVCVPTDVNVLC